jgi:hypothetical protein
MSNITIKEFRMWLEGVEEMQPENWSPDTNQWKKIREKLNTIEEPIPTISVQQPAVVYRAPEHQEPIYQGPVQMAQPGLRNISAPPANNALFAGDNPSTPVRTPNIDSSSGNYEPAFI